MIRSIKLKNIIGLLICIGIFSCKKDSEIFEAYKDIGQVENVLNKINNDTESYLINTAVNNQIISATGIVINVPKEVLLNSAGNLFTGEAKLFVIDLLTSGQSILSGINTKVEGSVFYSSSMVNITAQDLSGNELVLKNGAQIEVYQPKIKDKVISDSKMYKGISVSNTLNWTEIMSPSINNSFNAGNWEVVSENGSIFGYGYKYNVDQLGWTAIGNYHEKNGNENDKLCIILPELFNKNNTKVFFVFKEYISIVNLQPLEDTNGTFCGLIAKPNKGESSYIITISSTENGDAYLGYIENPELNENVIEVFPLKTSIETISQFLHKE